MPAIHNILDDLREFISPKNIAKLNEEFDHGDFVGSYITGEILTKRAILVDGFLNYEIQYVEGNWVRTGLISKENFFSNSIMILKNHLEIELSAMFFASEKSSKSMVLDTFFEEIDHIIYLCENQLEKKDQFIAQSLYDIKRYFLEKYQSSGYKGIAKVVGQNNRSKRLKWYGNPSTLATLFYDLSGGKRKNKKEFLKDIPADLVKFVFSNFTDADGKDLSMGTIQKYIYDEFKNAQERIDIDYYSKLDTDQENQR